MLIKAADTKQPAIDALEKLLTTASLTPQQKKNIEREKRILQAGIKGENESAYLIDFDFKPSKNWVVIHDLRLEINDRVAQIDHLLINRTLEVYVLETKSFNSGIKITEQGDFLRWNDYKKTYEGIPSPTEQNQRHIKVLKDAFKTIEMPKRAGITLMPTLFAPYTLISASSRIERPEQFDTSDVIKADTLHKTLMDRLSGSTSLNPIKIIGDAWETLNAATHIISRDTLRIIARQLAILHKPHMTDYAAKFGVQKTNPSQTTRPSQTSPSTQPASIKQLVTKPKTDAHQCRHCNSSHINIQYGKYGYYFKCTDCSGNTPIKTACNQSNCKARIRKQGNEFFRECSVCNTSDLYFVNETTPATATQT